MRIRKHIYGRKKRLVALAVVFAMACGLALTGCGSSASETAADNENAMSQSASDIETVQDMLDVIESSIDTEDLFTERDLAGTYDESETKTISLSSTDEEYADGSIEIDGSQIIIKEAGTYVISGELTNGTITVDAGDDDKVQLVLAGACISAENYAAIYAKNADKVFVTLAEDSENTLATTGDYVQTDDNNVDAVIFSKCDLVLNGTGSLEVTAETGHGIVSKDDLKVTGGTYMIDTPDHALNGKDSVRIAGGTFELICDEDGIHAGNDEQPDGYVYIGDGDFTISVGDDGIHAEGVVYITDGDIDITTSYEGIEGYKVLVSGGDIDIVSDDDGFNAAGGSSEEGGDNNAQMAPPQMQSGDMGEPQENPSVGDMDSDANAYLVITGGSITVSADGDGLDSNGYLGISGGEIYVLGPSNDGNGALDCGIAAAITGGTIVAAGGLGMAQGFGESSTQCSALIAFDSWIDAGETITLTDADGDVLLSYAADKTFDSVVISCLDMEDGGEYTIAAGSESVTFTMDGVTYSNKSGGMGGMPGGDMDNMPDGDMGGMPDEDMGVGAPPDGGMGGETPPDGNTDSTPDSVSM